MSKIVLNDVTNLSALSVINDNFDKIELEFQNKALYRDNPEGEPNTFETDADFNGHNIYNVQNLSVANSFTVNGKDIEVVVDDAIAGIEQSAASAANSATAAASSAASAASSASTAITQASTATTKASEASTSATNAGASATAAAASAVSAGNSATSATASASTATTQAGIATTQASSASASAESASGSATSASSSASNAASSATSATNSASAAAASAAEAATFDPDLFLAKSGNLSGLANTATSRTNLGVAIGSDVQAYDVDTAKTDVVQTFSAAQRGAVISLTNGATVTPNFALANNFSLTLTGNSTLSNPTNIVAGQSGVIAVTQDATGSRTLAFGSYWKFAAGAAPSLTTAAASVDDLAYYVESSTRIVVKALGDAR